MRFTSALGTALSIFWALQTEAAIGNDEPAVKVAVSFKDLGALDTVAEVHSRLGSMYPMFLIEDHADFHRHMQLFPNLPKVNFGSEAILIVTSWHQRPRSVQFARREGEQLVLGVERPPPPEIHVMDYAPPIVKAYALPAWPGSVRFELDGREEFTVLRGEELEARVEELCNEILRIRSGGRPTREQYLRRYRKMWPKATEEELHAGVAKLRNETLKDPMPFYTMLLRELGDMRARPAIPRIFDLMDRMEDTDQPFSAARKAIVAIGGAEAVTRCKAAFRSRNDVSRLAGMLILRDFGLPETREIAHAHLHDPYAPVGRVSLDLLHRLGHDVSDVPELVRAIRELEESIFSEDSAQARLRRRGGGAYDILTLIGRLGYIGPEASMAIPELEQIASIPKYPESRILQEAAKEALAEIRAKPTQQTP